MTATLPHSKHTNALTMHGWTVDRSVTYAANRYRTSTCTAWMPTKFGVKSVLKTGRRVSKRQLRNRINIQPRNGAKRLNATIEQRETIDPYDGLVIAICKQAAKDAKKEKGKWHDDAI